MTFFTGYRRRLNVEVLHSWFDKLTTNGGLCGGNDVIKMREVDGPRPIFSFGNNVDELVVEIYLLRRIFIKRIDRGGDGLIVAENGDGYPALRGLQLSLAPPVQGAGLVNAVENVQVSANIGLRSPCSTSS